MGNGREQGLEKDGPRHMLSEPRDMAGGPINKFWQK